MHYLVAVTLLAALASATPIRNAYYYSDIPSASALRQAGSINFLRSSAFEKPIFVATPTAGSGDDLTAFLIDGGYRSLAVMPQFRTLRDNLLAGEKTVFLVNPSGRSIASTLPLKHLIVPEHYSSLMRSAQFENIMSHPIIVLLDHNDLKSDLYTSLKKVHAVDVTDDSLKLIKSAQIGFEPAHTFSGLRSFAVEHPALHYTSGLRSHAFAEPALKYSPSIHSIAVEEPALKYSPSIHSIAVEEPALKYSPSIHSIAVEEPALLRSSGLQYLAYPQAQRSVATPYMLQSLASYPYSSLQRAVAEPSYVLPQMPVTALNYQPVQRFASAPYVIPQESILVNPNYAALQGVRQGAFGKSEVHPTFYIVLNNDLANAKMITEAEAMKLLTHGKMGLVNMESLTEAEKSSVLSSKSSGANLMSSTKGSSLLETSAQSGSKSSGNTAETVTKTIEKTIITSTGNAAESAATTGTEAVSTGFKTVSNSASGVVGEKKLGLLGGIVKAGSEIVSSGANVVSSGAQGVSKAFESGASTSLSSESSGALLGGLLKPIVKTGADLVGTGASAVDSAASHVSSALEGSPLGLL